MARRFADRQQTAEYLCGTSRWLEGLAAKGEGPFYRIIAGKAVYDLDEVDEWAESLPKHRSTEAHQRTAERRLRAGAE